MIFLSRRLSRSRPRCLRSLIIVRGLLRFDTVKFVYLTRAQNTIFSKIRIGSRNQFTNVECLCLQKSVYFWFESKYISSVHSFIDNLNFIAIHLKLEVNKV